MPEQPPRLGTKILAVLTAGNREFAADLHFLYLERCNAVGGLRAGLWYWKQLIWFALLRPISPGNLHSGNKRKASSMDHLIQDISFSLRSLLRQKSFAVVVLLTLVLGIGMNTAIFSILYGALYRPLEYRSPEELIQVGRTRTEVANALLPVSIPMFLDMQSDLGSLAGFEAYTGSTALLGIGSDSKLAQGTRVTGGMFNLLGVPALLGRGLVPSDGDLGSEKVVVLSDEMWRSSFGSDPSIVGTVVNLSEEPHTVVGVMPAGFKTGNGLFWVPFQWTDEQKSTNRGSNFLRIHARVPDGSDLTRISEELDVKWRNLGARFQDSYDESGMAAMPLLDYKMRRSRGGLTMLGGAVGLVLLIACVNVINLLMVRNEARQKEITVRAALGASRARIVKQLLTESFVVSGVGGVLGVVTAAIALRAMLQMFGDQIPRADEIGLDSSVLLFSVALTLITGLLVGIVPAMRAGGGSDQLRSSRGATGRVSYLQRSLIVTEVALALMLVTGTGLLVKSFWVATSANLGLAANNILAANIFLPSAKYPDGEQRRSFFTELKERLEATPGIEGTAMTSMVPIRNFGFNVNRVEVDGEPDRFATFVEFRSVTPDYFDTMGIPVLQGRVFANPGEEDSRREIVINQELSDQLFPDGDAVGRRLARNGGLEIVGVVGNVKQYGPDRRQPPGWYQPTRTASNLMIRTAGSAGDFVANLRGIVASVDPDASVFRLATMDQIVSESLGPRRFQLILLTIFAGVALSLGTVGIYGVLSYSVERRTKEIGVRLALGALPSAVIRDVVVGGGVLVALGVVVGLGGSFAMQRFITGLLYGVEGVDLTVYAAVSAVLLTVSLLAAVQPARRAASVDPVQVLRDE